MFLNIAAPASGTQKTFELEAEQKLRHLYDRNLGTEVKGDLIGYPGYVFRITGGSDKDGFPMKQGVLINSRVKLLLTRGSVGYCPWRGRRGERQRRTVRGCITGPDLAVICLCIVKKGDEDIAGVTDMERPRTLGPKKASKLRKLYGLPKTEQQLKPFVHRKKCVKKGGDANKYRVKVPKIQRLVTPAVVHRRAQKKAATESRWVRAREDRLNYQRRLDAIARAGRQRKAANDRKKAAGKAKVAK